MSFPVSIMENAKRMLRFSIRSNISATYIRLYSVAFIWLVLLLAGGFIHHTKQEFAEQNYQVMNMVVEKVQEDGNRSELQTILDGVYKEEKIGILILDPANDQRMSNALDYPIWNYDKIVSESWFQQEMKLFSLLPYKLMALEANGENGRTVVFFYSVSSQMDLAKNMLGYLLLGYVSGVLLLWIAGGMKVRRIIQPIERITNATKSINTKNLDARIDVGRAKYELKDLASTINDMMDRMQDGYKKQQQFVSDVSHELRTPISVINGYANLLDRWGKEDPAILQEAIDALKSESQNMADLVEKLLFLARYDRDALKYDMQSIDFSELMDEVGKETEMIDQHHRIQWTVEENLMLYGDANRIKQVARIFVDNAVKYSPEGKDIEIRGYRDKNYVVLEVEDHGMGIPKEKLKSVFERFYRTDESRNKNTGGYGLGLSIARIIVLQHGGKIRVRSKPDSGSVFSALFPMKVQATTIK